MEHTIAALLKQYEIGGLNRRELIRGLAMLAGVAAAPAGPAAAQGTFQWVPSIDHIQVNSANVRRSAEFYQKVLGLELFRVGPRDKRNCCPDEWAFLGVGNRVLVAVRKEEQASQKINHVALLMTNFDERAVPNEIKARGGTFDGPYIVDPDGVRIEIEGKPGLA